MIARNLRVIYTDTAGGSSSVYEEPEPTGGSSAHDGWVTYAVAELPEYRHHDHEGRCLGHMTRKQWRELRRQRCAEWAAELREIIKPLARAVYSAVTKVLEAPFREVPFHRRLCTPGVPGQHWRTHNSPVRFLREGL